MRIIVNEYKYECHCINQNKIACEYNQWVLIKGSRHSEEIYIVSVPCQSYWIQELSTSDKHNIV